MKIPFDRENLRIRFCYPESTCRNIYEVTEIEFQGNLMVIKTADEKVIIINFNNVNSIEEISP